MLQLTQQQVFKISQQYEQVFINELISYYKQHIATRSLNITEEELRVEINDLVNQAKYYGYKLQKEIFLYIEIVMLTGTENSQNGKFSWVYERLKQNSKASPVDIQQIYDTLINRLSSEH